MSGGLTRMRPRTDLHLAACCAIIALATTRSASAASFSYPVNDCVSVKQTLSGSYCQGVLKAWATFDQKGDAGKRDAAIQAAAATLASKWSAAEAAASKKGTNCAETTLSVTQAQTLIDAALNALVSDVNAGL